MSNFRTNLPCQPWLTILVVLGLVAGFPVRAVGDYQQGLGHFVDNHPEAAFGVWLQAALDGDARSQAAVASLLDNGHGVRKNTAAAMYWYRIAAGNGHPHARLVLGMYYAGREFPDRDLVEACAWLQLAAESGLDQARHSRDLVSELLDKEQLNQANARADDYRIGGAMSLLTSPWGGLLAWRSHR